MKIVPFHTLESGASKPRSKSDVIDTIVLHYTATADLPRFYNADRFLKLVKDDFAKKVISEDTYTYTTTYYANRLTVPDASALCAIAAGSPREASWHYCIPSVATAMVVDPGKGAKKGNILHDFEVIEFVDPSRIAHHVGPLSGATNRRSIGIEICYPGHAPRKIDGKVSTLESASLWYKDRSWNVMYTEKLLCPDGSKHWFADLGIAIKNTVVDLCEFLCRRYDIKAICSHYIFAPTKRIDPDPPLSLDEVRSSLTERTGKTYASRPPRR